MNSINLYRLLIVHPCLLMIIVQSHSTSLESQHVSVWPDITIIAIM